MIDKVPTHLILLLVFGLMVSGPVVFFSFVMGGGMAGFIALGICMCAFVTLYIIAGRMSSKEK